MIRKFSFKNNRKLFNNIELYLMLLLPIIYYFIYHYIPMYGITIAFKKFSIGKGIIGSNWVGFEHFDRLFSSPVFFNVLGNTLIISISKLLFSFPAPIILALMLNEIKNMKFRKLSQTVYYLPHFISWVVLGGIIMDILSPSTGMVNGIIKALGGQPIFFMAKSGYFRTIVVISNIWKEAGWGSIIYLAAMTSINPEIYESAMMDGAGRIRQMWSITIPSITSVIVIVFILNVGKIMSAGFEQIFVLQNNYVLDVAEVIDTYVYKVGLLQLQYSFTTAVGLFKSVVGLILVIITNRIAKMVGEYGVW